MYTHIQKQGPNLVYADVDIVEDDGSGVLRFERTRESRLEDAGFVHLYVERRGGALREVSVKFRPVHCVYIHICIHIYTYIYIYIYTYVYTHIYI